MEKYVKNITVVGGGTAGWISALYINKFFPEFSISLITDSSIGILGAGEGTTYNFTKLLNTLDIDETDFIFKTKATKKIGINLKNWRGDGTDFNHSTVIPDTSWYFFHFDARLLADYFKNIAITRGIKYIDANVSDFIQNEKDITGIKYGDNILNCDFVIDCSGFSRLIIGKLYNTEWISYSHELRLNKAFAYFLPQTKEIKEDDRFYTTSIAMDAGWMW